MSAYYTRRSAPVTSVSREPEPTISSAGHADGRGSQHPSHSGQAIHSRASTRHDRDELLLDAEESILVFPSPPVSPPPPPGVIGARDGAQSRHHRRRPSEPDVVEITASTEQLSNIPSTAQKPLDTQDGIYFGGGRGRRQKRLSSTTDQPEDQAEGAAAGPSTITAGSQNPNQIVHPIDTTVSAVGARPTPGVYDSSTATTPMSIPTSLISSVEARGSLSQSVDDIRATGTSASEANHATGSRSNALGLTSQRRAGQRPSEALASIANESHRLPSVSDADVSMFESVGPPSSASYALVSSPTTSSLALHPQIPPDVGNRTVQHRTARPLQPPLPQALTQDRVAQLPSHQLFGARSTTREDADHPLWAWTTEASSAAVGPERPLASQNGGNERQRFTTLHPPSPLSSASSFLQGRRPLSPPHRSSALRGRPYVRMTNVASGSRHHPSSSQRPEGDTSGLGALHFTDSDIEEAETDVLSGYSSDGVPESEDYDSLLFVALNPDVDPNGQQRTLEEMYNDRLLRHQGRAGHAIGQNEQSRFDFADPLGHRYGLQDDTNQATTRSRPLASSSKPQRRQRRRRRLSLTSSFSSPERAASTISSATSILLAHSPKRFRLPFESLLRAVFDIDPATLKLIRHMSTSSSSPSITPPPSLRSSPAGLARTRRLPGSPAGVNSRSYSPPVYIDHPAVDYHGKNGSVLFPGPGALSETATTPDSGPALRDSTNSGHRSALSQHKSSRAGVGAALMIGLDDSRHAAASLIRGFYALPPIPEGEEDGKYGGFGMDVQDEGEGSRGSMLTGLLDVARMPGMVVRAALGLQV